MLQPRCEAWGVGFVVRILPGHPCAHTDTGSSLALGPFSGTFVRRVPYCFGEPEKGFWFRV